jgi:hypothetical protein
MSLEKKINSEIQNIVWDSASEDIHNSVGNAINNFVWNSVWNFVRNPVCYSFSDVAYYICDEINEYEFRK